jgi:protoporphyrinogen oxidase
MLEKNEISELILGAGIAGLSCSYHLNEHSLKPIIIEKENRYGGLCDNFSVKGFRFDRFVHFTFADKKHTRDILEKNIEMYLHRPEASNYSKGFCMRHPLQNNLFNLPVDEKVRIIESFIEPKIMAIKDIENYEQWLKYQYGDYFAENYPMKYTRKYWTLEAEDMEVKWVGNRMSQPTLSEVLKGAIAKNKDNNFYTNEMRYPKKGGFKSILKEIVKKSNITLNTEIKVINLKASTVTTDKGDVYKYRHLFSSLPLPLMISMIKDAPESVKEASKKLFATSGYLVCFGFNKDNIPKKLWSYIYDEDILASRIWSPSLKSSDNAPYGKSSLVAEVFESKEKLLNMTKEEILEKTRSQLIGMGLFTLEDIEVEFVKYEPYANVIFNHDIYHNREIVKKFLNKFNVSLIGRFGEWDYFWSNQSFESGERAANKYVSGAT